MPEEQKRLMMELAERVGIPTTLLFLLLWGGYNLLQPVSNAAIAHFETQTTILKTMALDLEKTRIVVEIDQAEKKGLLLENMSNDLEKMHHNIFDKLEEINNKLK